MAWFDDSSSKVYETDDYEEYKFLKRSTSWDVRYTGDQDETEASEQPQKRSADEIIRQAYESYGLSYDERKAAHAEQNIPKTGKELTAFVQDHLNEIKSLHNRVVRASQSHQKAGRYEKAREGYEACLKLNRMADEFIRTPKYKNGRPEPVQQMLDHLHTLRANVRKLKAKC